MSKQPLAAARGGSCAFGRAVASLGERRIDAHSLLMHQSRIEVCRPYGRKGRVDRAGLNGHAGKSCIYDVCCVSAGS